MKIGYDAKRAANNFTGLGNYSRFVIENMAKIQEDDLYLYTPKNRSHASFVSLFRYDKVYLKLPKCSYFTSFWRSCGIASDLIKDQVDIYHGLSNEIPFGMSNLPLKKIVTIHDLIFLRLPSTYKWLDRWIYNIKFRYACKHSDVVVAISECTKRDIVEFYGIDPEKIKVIYQSCDIQFQEKASEFRKKEVRKKYHLPEKYILNVGSLEPRKNALLIVQALEKLDYDAHLVLVGKRTSYVDKIIKYAENHNLSSRIHIVSGVKFGDLPLFYQMADVFVFPSFFEGFGIPILEALYSEVPVIAAKGSCLEEAGGENSMYINPKDASALSEAITKVLTNTELRANMIAKGKEHLRKFDAELLTRQMKTVYEMAKGMRK